MFEIHVALRPSSPPRMPSSGRLWIVLGGRAFPAQGWTDLPASVLSSMATAYREIADGAPQARSYFFDGPYHLCFERRSPSADGVIIEASTDRRGCSERVVPPALVPLGDLRDALLVAAATMLAELAEGEGYAEDEVAVVMSIVDRVRAAEHR